MESGRRNRGSLLLPLLLFLGAAVRLGLAGDCPADGRTWVPFGDRCYHFIHGEEDRIKSYTFERAKTLCQSFELLTIQSAEENDFVIEYCPNVWKGKVNVWLGMYYDTNDEDMRWFHEEPVKFTNWEDGSPTSGLVPVDTCVALHSNTGRWENVSCMDEVENGVICETAQAEPVRQKPNALLSALVILSVVAIIAISYPGLDFEALLIKPKEAKDDVKLPLIVIPHGGPHSVIVADWLPSCSVHCKMGFAVLLVNYRGSLGFGQDSIYSLPGNIGTQDVRDVQFAVESVLNSGNFDVQKVAVSGGSHGGFLACHLIGQYPGFYQACVARNPVTNLASMIGSTDIPDWCMVEAGFDYSADCLPDPAVWGLMLDKSPIKYISQVKTPVLLALGEEDKRVPNKQGMEYYKALKAKQIPVRLLWYPGNNHALSKVDAESDGFMNVALWIIQHLKP